MTTSEQMTTVELTTTKISVARGIVVEGSTKLSKVIIGPVAIFEDGSIERTAAFTTNDVAALEFWKAVEDFYGRMNAARASLLEAYASTVRSACPPAARPMPRQ